MSNKTRGRGLVFTFLSESLDTHGGTVKAANVALSCSDI